MLASRWAFRAVLVSWVLLARCQEEGDESDYDDQDIEEESLTAEQLNTLHAKFDQNGDGRVSLTEVMNYADEVGRAIAAKDISAILEEIDTSKDGRLTLEEHLSDIHNQADGGDEEEIQELEQRKKVEAAKFAAADVNGDGFLDKDEVPALFYPETNDRVLRVTVEETLRQKDSDKDGKINVREFWEADEEGGLDGELSEEEIQDFKKLDKNGDGFLDFQELSAWESGRFHTEEAMKKLIEMADKDNDMHVTAAEMASARDDISTSDAQYHLVEWAEHNEL